MTAQFRNWQAVQDEVLRRIHAREWMPGELIPNEADLAQEFGCARATVNRALRAVAQNGLLERRRKAGTRVAAQPVAKATLNIAVFRKEVEDRGQKYGYHRIEYRRGVPPMPVCAAMKVPADRPMIFVRALHLADDMPYAYENRWINPDVMRGDEEEEFDRVSANEWLLEHAPYTDGEISFSASSATQDEADYLGCPAASAVMVMDRLTWNSGAAVTSVRVLFAPSHKLRTVL